MCNGNCYNNVGTSWWDGGVAEHGSLENCLGDEPTGVQIPLPPP